jgi:hypothetical protein
MEQSLDYPKLAPETTAAAPDGRALTYFQTVKQQPKELIAGCYARLANQTASAGL